MGYAVVLYFDAESSAKIDAIRFGLKNKGINIDEGVKPHLSLAVYDDLPIFDFENEFRLYARDVKAFEVVFPRTGEFRTAKPVIFLEPERTPELIETHEQFHAYFSKYDDLGWKYYKPGMWYPHSTLCLDLTEEMYKKAKELLNEIRLPIKVRIEQIGLLEFSPHKELINLNLG